jgi:hypothetical protein
MVHRTMNEEWIILFTEIYNNLFNVENEIYKLVTVE